MDNTERANLMAQNIEDHLAGLHANNRLSEQSIKQGLRRLARGYLEQADRIEELEAKLAEAEAERDQLKRTGQECINAWKARAEATEAMLPRADLPATDAQALANPKVKALVEAAKDACQELEQAQLSQIAAKNYALAGLAITAHDNLGAALAALEAKP